MDKKYLALLIVLLTIAIQQSYATGDNTDKLKAVYLVNFARFINWDHTNNGNINLCVHKNTSIYEYLDKINNIDIGHGRKLVVLINPEEFNRCEIAYWDKQTVDFRDPAAMEGVLEITDFQEAFNKGMDMLFFLENNKLRFYIADDAYDTKDIKISSKLMRLSKPPSDFSGGGITTDFFAEHSIVFNNPYIKQRRVSIRSG